MLLEMPIYLWGLSLFKPIQFQPAADWQIQEECVEAKEERQHHIESKNEEKK